MSVARPQIARPTDSPASSWLPAVACMALAAALRLPGLDAQSLWIDEIYSVEMTGWTLADMLRVQDGHPPLFALLQRGLMAVLPLRDLSGRLIAAVAGIVAVGVMVRLGTRLFGRRTGVVAGVLLALSPLHVWYSQEGRMYALVVLFGLVSSLALAATLEGGSWRTGLAFLLASVGGIFTHYLYAGLIGAQVAFLLLQTRLDRRLLAGLAVCLALAVASLPVLGPEATSFVGAQRGFEWLALPYAGFTFLGGFGLGPPIEELHRHRGIAVLLPYWPGIATVAAAGIAIIVGGLRAARAAGAWGRYVVLWALVPALLAFAGSWAMNGAFNVRYTIVALPGFLLMAALAVTSGGRLRLWAGTLVLALLSLTSIARERVDPRYAREDLRAAARFLAAHARPGERIVVSGHYMLYGVGYYFPRGNDLEALPVRPIRSADDVESNLRELGARPTWLVLTRDWEDDPVRLLPSALDRASGVEPRARFAGVRIYQLGGPAGHALGAPTSTARGPAP